MWVFNMPHPDIDLKTTFDKGLSKAIQPIYPSTEKLSNRGVSNRVICKIMEQIFLQLNGRFEESLSSEILEHQKLISKSEALLNIHFPSNQRILRLAQFRLKFEELFYIQIQLILKNIILIK